jgi:hypothetical protein
VGSKHSLRVRIRGQGSGFLEGPHDQELPEPLHFNVSADSEHLLKVMVSRMKSFIDQVRMELHAGIPVTN